MVQRLPGSRARRALIRGLTGPLAQTWNDVLFAHWPLEPAALRELIPPRLTLDTADGMAWLGIVPFWISDLRLRAVLPLAGLSRFPELNVRTYVVAEDRPGVWFFSLDAGSAAVVALARRWFSLPYYAAHMQFTPTADSGQVAYASRRTHRGAPPAELRGTYGPTGAATQPSPGSLEAWLVERYCLYTVDTEGTVLRTDIEHRPWELAPAEAEFATNTMAEAVGISLPGDPPLLHFAKRQAARAWAPQVVRG